MSTISSSRPTAVNVLGIGIAVLVLLAAVTLPPEYVAREVQRTLGVFLATVVLWITRPVPYVVSSVLSVVLLYAFGVVPTFEEAASGFATVLVFFIVLLLLIGKSVSKVDLDRWIANRLVNETMTPRSSVQRLIGTMLLLAFLMPSGIARGVTFMPIIDRLSELYDVDETSEFRRLAYYVVGHLNPIAGLSLMTGGGMAVATAEMIGGSVRPISWVGWALYMIPPVVLLFVGSAVVGLVIYDVDDSSHTTDDRARSRPGEPDPSDATVDPLSRDQRIVVATLALAIIAWIIGSFLGVPNIVPAMAMVLVLSAPGIGILTGADVRELNWGIVFLFGAMLSLIAVMRDVGAFELLIDSMAVGIPLEAPVAVVLGFLCCTALLVRSLFSSVTAAFLVLYPIFLEFAALIGVEQLYLSFGLAILLMSSTFLPFNNPPVLLAYERGPLNASEVFRLGLLTTGMAVVVIVFGWVIYWPVVDYLV